MRAPSFEHRRPERARHGGGRHAERVRGDLGRVPRDTVRDDLSLAQGQRQHSGGHRLVAVGDDVAAPVRLEPIDERPGVRDEAAPRFECRVGIGAALSTAGSVDGHRPGTQRFERGPPLCVPVRVLHATGRIQDGLGRREAIFERATQPLARGQMHAHARPAGTRGSVGCRGPVVATAEEQTTTGRVEPRRGSYFSGR